MFADNPGEDASIQSLLMRISHLYFSKTFEQLANTGVHPGQIPMLKLLARESGLSQREISQKLHIKPPTVTVSLKRMEKSGLIEKTPDSKDQRVIRISLSEKGKQFQEELFEHIKENEHYMYEGFTEGEMYLMKRFLHQIIKNLSNIPVDKNVKKDPHSYLHQHI